MLIAHKIALNPNNIQATYFAKAADTARFAYNWALTEWQQQYSAWKENNSLDKPTQAALRRQLNAIKREQFPWMLAVTKNAPQMAIIQLGEAFNAFFKGRASYPTYRKKGVDDRFTLTNDQLGFFEFKRQLQYKAQWYGADVILADRWFPSSKLCSSCGQKNEALALSIRKWVCQNCHTQHDRDVNAAINLAIYAVSSTVSACGEESAGCDPRIAVKLASVKQEVNTNNYL